MRAKQVRKMVLSLLLSAIMVVEPAAGSVVAYAAEPDSEQTISFDESDSEEVGSESEDAVGEDVSDENTSDETGSEQGNSNDDVSDENGDGQDSSDENGDEQDMSDENNSEEENAEEPADESEGLEEESEEDIENPSNEETTDIEFSVPSNYILSAEQQKLKVDLAANMASFDESEEGNLYVEREVIALADTKEEAEIIAEAYQAELTEYSLGVATLKLKENVSVGKAVYAAASLENNLPPVFPNYYRYAHTIEVQDDSYVGESPAETYQMDAMAYNDPFLQANSTSYQWQHVNVGSIYAWDAGYKGKDIKVAVLDTGVTSPNASELTVLGNYNTSDSSTADDMQGHGTHVAGIIAAQLNNNYRGAGIAPEAKIYNVKVLGDNGSGSDDAIIRGIEQATTLGVDLINMSLGGIGYNSLYEQCIEKAYNKGIAVFASAGNDGGSTMCYPAAYNHVICVAAVDSNNQRASFSNYGSWVDLSAPGVGIWSITSTAAYSDGYVSMDGTSQACPVAVGEAAVILAANPEALNGKSGKDRVDALEKFMKANTVSAGSGMGKGITSLTKALKLSVMTAKPATPTITATYDNPETPQMVTISIAAGAGAATDIYYTVDGKNPTFKNGLQGATTQLYTVPFSISDKKSGTIKAIAVNSQTGVSSAVAQVKFTLKPYVKTIEISGPTQVAKGKSIQLSAEVGPDYAANKSLKWEIDPADAASAGSGVSISQKGKVTATANAGAGKYTVTVTAQDGASTPAKMQYTITVIDAVKVQSVKFKSTKLTLERGADNDTCDMGEIASGEKGFLTVTTANPEVPASAADLTWTSSNKTIATVSDLGVVTLKAPGTVTITALSNDGGNKKATCKITVKQLSTGVSIEGPTQLAKGKKVTLKATVAPANVSNKKVTWNATGPDNEVKVNAKGVVTATSKAAGEYVITATPADGKGTPKTHTITVKSGVITSISMSDKKAKIFRVSNAFTAKDSATITATIKGNDDFAANALTITSSNTGVATASMSQAGNDVTITVKATNKATGTTKITLASTDGSNKKATCTVTVVNPVSRINIATGGNSRYVAQGKSLQLKATLESEYGAVSNKGVTWTIDDTDPGVTINASKGKVTASKNANVNTESDGYGIKRPVRTLHTVTATAKDGSGVSVTFNIYVTQPVKGLQLYYIADWYDEDTPIWKKWPSNAAMVYKNTDVEDLFILDWDNYTATGGPDGIYGGVTLSSSNPSVVSISTYQGYMHIVIKKKGSATITIKAMDGGGASTKRKIIVR